MDGYIHKRGSLVLMYSLSWPTVCPLQFVFGGDGDEVEIVGDGIDVPLAIWV